MSHKLTTGRLAGATVIAWSVLLLITADTVTSSPTTKNRGACNRTISGCLVLVDELPMPNWLPAVATRAVAVHVVNESGYFTFTVAVPSASVFTSGNHRIVERKSLLT